jgi:hypothetical protein
MQSSCLVFSCGAAVGPGSVSKVSYGSPCFVPHVGMRVDSQQRIG